MLDNNMQTDIATQKKLMLTDPVQYYTAHISPTNKQVAQQLASLRDKYRQYKADFDAIDNQTKELSKKIGAAKKHGHDCEELISKMQNHSKQKSILQQQLQSIESEIFAAFTIESIEQKPKKKADLNFTSRQYSLANCKIEEITVKVLGDNHADWNRYVNNNPAASIYHLAQWRDVIKSTFGHDSIYFYAVDAYNSVRGVLPLIRLKSLLFGDFLISMPYFNYGGAIADHPTIEASLMATANNYAEKINVSHIEYRDDISHDEYPTRTDKVNMILPLPSDQQVLWESFTPKLRAQIKRPQRENPEILFGSNELLNDFYEVFAQNMRDLGTPVYGKSFFQNILNTFPNQTQILTISINKKPVAAAFLIGYGNTLEIPWASTLRKVNHLSINMLMYWEVLCFAVNNNYKYFDFGRSTKNAGTYQFKKQWGALPKQLYWHYWLAQGNKIPSMNPHNPKYAAAIATWKRLPVAVSKILGPLIVKNLP